MTKDVAPTTQNGIKRLARELKAERGLKHTEALDAASRQAGYENFRHAQKALHISGASVLSGSTALTPAPTKIRNMVVASLGYFGEQPDKSILIGRKTQNADELGKGVELLKSILERQHPGRLAEEMGYLRGDQYLDDLYVATIEHYLALRRESRFAEADGVADLLLAYDERDGAGIRETAAIDKLWLARRDGKDPEGVASIVQRFEDDTMIGIMLSQAIVGVMRDDPAELEMGLKKLIRYARPVLSVLTGVMPEHDSDPHIGIRVGGTTEAIQFWSHNAVALDAFCEELAVILKAAIDHPNWNLAPGQVIHEPEDEGLPQP